MPRKSEPEREREREREKEKMRESERARDRERERERERETLESFQDSDKGSDASENVVFEMQFSEVGH